MALTIVRLPSSTQIGSFLTQASASATYLTKSSASTTYSPINSPTFTGTVNTAAVDMNGILNLNNYNITNVNNLEFNDGGVGEGLSWLGGNLWKVYESPNSLINSASGNFQIVQDSTRRLTIDSSNGVLSTHRSLFIGDDRTSTESLFLEIGNGRSASGYAYIDLIGDTTYTDYGLRLIRNNGGANTDSILSHRGTGILAISAQDAGSVRLSTNGTSRVEVKSTGEVGIGTTSPLANLHIIDPASAASDIRLGNNVNGTVMNLFSSTADLLINNVTASGSFSLGTNNTSRMTINSTGDTTFTGILTGNTLVSNNSSGSEGGEIRLATPATGTSITTGVTIDVQTNLFRIFETGGTNRGVSLDITSLPAGVSSQIALRSNTTFIGTTSIALNRTSAAQTLTGVSLSSGAAIGSLTFTSGTISSTGSIALSPATGSNETALNAIVRMPDVYNRTTTAASNMLIATVPLAEVFRSTASSQRWKNSIDNLTGELEASKLLDIPVRQFKFNNDYLNQEDKRYDTLVPGFVAEEVAEYYPIAAEMGEDGKVDDWNVRMIIPPMLKLIQDQDKKIKELETRISSIENN